MGTSYKERLVLCFDREKARQVLRDRGLSVYRVAVDSGGSNRRFQRYFMPSSPAYRCVETNTISELAWIVGCSPMDFLTLLGPKERGGERDLPPEMWERPDSEVMRNPQPPAKAIPNGGSAHSGVGAETSTAVQGDLEEEVVDPFA